MAYLFSVAMSIPHEYEAEFNRLYDDEHLPMLAGVPGVTGAVRFRRREFEAVADGRVRTQEVPAGEPVYYALYELERPEIVVSDEWLAARARGSWSTRVGRHATSMRRMMLERL